MRFPGKYTFVALAFFTLPAHAQVTAFNGLSVIDPYACAGDTAVYMAIQAEPDVGDVLVGGSADIAEETELSTYVTELGVLRVRQLDSLDIDDGTTVELVPGGHHFRLYGLASPLAVGTSFPLKMQFSELDEAEIQVPVVACQPAVEPPVGEPAEPPLGEPGEPPLGEPVEPPFGEPVEPPFLVPPLLPRGSF